MSVDTTFLRRCLTSVERALEEIEQLDSTDENVMYDIYRAACVKEFERVPEQSGKLLRKRLAAYLASNRQADRLEFRDLYRHGAIRASGISFLVEARDRARLPKRVHREIERQHVPLNREEGGHE